uniref:SXP/RAL-2 family protein Ani s 5-like cation-binding domain-containing protein n=1 Tax=Panagrolaimus davidi TaxID=227884 RepID=A0A914QPI6_9BILA
MMMKNCIVLIAVGLFVGTGIVFGAEEEKTKIPKFLEGSDAKTVEEFEKILSKSGDLTDKQIDEAIDAWAEKQSAGIKTKYIEFRDELKKYQETSEAAHKASIAKFTADAKSADEKLSAVANNPAFSAKEKGQKLEEIISKLPKNVQEEIEKAMKEGS